MASAEPSPSQREAAFELERGTIHALVGRHVAEGRGSKVAIRTPDMALTYAGLQARLNRAANALQALGVEPEQRVALLLPDGVDLATCLLGAIAIGAVAIPMNTRLNATEYGGILRDSRASVLVVHASLFDSLRDQLEGLPGLKAVLVAGGGAAGFASLDDVLARAPDTLDVETPGQDTMAVWLYTSGTTGFPKAAVHLHRTLLAGHYFGCDVLGHTAADRVFATSKLFFAYALGNALINPLLFGAETYLYPDWADPPAVERVVREYQPTLFFSVPTLYARLLRAELPADAFRSVRLCVSAGERLPGEAAEAWETRFSAPILDGIGATETIYMFLSNTPHLRKPGSSGTPVPGTEARILDSDDNPVPDGEEGVLWAKTPSMAFSYWNRVDLSRSTFVGEWYRTRDVYVRTPDGFYEHHGREDDFFKVAGQWVPPAAVEAAFLAHPAVSEVGVVGAEDDSGLVKPFAFVVPRDPAADAQALAADLEAFTAERLRTYQRPRRIAVVPELPRTATGKLQRFKLKALLEQGG